MVKKTINDIYNKFTESTFVIVDNASYKERTINILNELSLLSRVYIHRFIENGNPRRVLYEPSLEVFTKTPFILTDPDLDLSNLPNDTIDTLMNLSIKYNRNKVGLALDISDKDDFITGGNYYDTEISYWNNKVTDSDYELYNAPIDTTFCLVKSTDIPSYFWNNMRIAGQYTVKHLPWHKSYIDALNKEDYNDYFYENTKNNIINGISTCSVKVVNYITFKEYKYNHKMLPIFIPCHNNGWMVKKTITDLYKFKMCEFFIQDNASTGKNTLNILNDLKKLDRVNVIHYEDNKGPWRVYQDERFKQYHNTYYILTDPDLDLSTLPDDVIYVLLKLANKYNIDKLGLALDISDINDLRENTYKEQSVYWMNKWYLPEDPKYDLYNAQIDTTFCLIRNNNYNGHRQIRLGGKYTVKHLPFHKSYIDSIDEEDFNEYFNNNNENISSNTREILKYRNKQ
jgi:hypothetical protein